MQQEKIINNDIFNTFNELEKNGTIDFKKLLNSIDNQKFLIDFQNHPKLFNLCLNKTEGFILYLYKKHNVVVKKSLFNEITNNNFQYIYHYHKNSLTLEDLKKIKQIISTSKHQTLLSSSDYPDIKDFKDIFKNSLDDFENIFHLKIAEEFNNILSKYSELSIQCLIDNEDFFLTYYAYNKIIPESIENNLVFDTSSFDSKISEPLFELVASSLKENKNIFLNHEFKSRYFNYLKSITNGFFKPNSPLEVLSEDFQIFLELIENFEFEENSQHKEVFSTLSMVACTLNPKEAFFILNELKNSFDNSEFFIFNNYVQFINLNVFLENKRFSKDFLFKHINAFRNRLLNDINDISKVDISLEILHEIINSYIITFDFDYNHQKFYNYLLDNTTITKILEIKPEISSYLLGFNYLIPNRTIPDSKLITFNFFFNFLLSYSHKIQFLSEEYYDNQVKIKEFLSYYPTVAKIQNLKKDISNFFEVIASLDNSHLLNFDEDDILEISETLYQINRLDSLLNENNLLPNLTQFVSINEDNTEYTLSIILEDINVLNISSKEFIQFCNPIAPHHFQTHEDRIKENLITQILFSAINSLQLNYANKPKKNFLETTLIKPPSLKLPNAGMLPPTPFDKQEKLNLNNEVTHPTIELSKLFELIFTNEYLFKNENILRFLFVYYFNNITFNFLNSEIKEKLSQKIHSFLMKNYVFEQGYNFSNEITKTNDLNFPIILKERNFFIELSHVVSSPKYASFKLLNNFEDFQTNYYMLPCDDLKFYNSKLIPLIKSFYINLSVLIDFKYEKKSFDGYNKLFNIISKVLLQELYETNYFNVDNKTTNFRDILDLLFNESNNLSIQKLSLYKDVQEYLRSINYNVYSNALSKEEVINKQNFTFMRDNSEGAKKFFILSLFMSDDTVVSDIVKSFFYNHTLSDLHNLLYSNNILVDFSSKIFSDAVIAKTFSDFELENHFQNTINRIFIEEGYFKNNIDLSCMNYFNLFLEQYSCLKKYGFIKKKLELPSSFNNEVNLLQFLKIFFELQPLKNFSLESKHLIFFELIDFNLNIVKNFIIQNYPQVFLFEPKQTPLYNSNNLYSLFNLTKEEMLDCLKKSFDKNNPEWFATTKDFFKENSLLNFINHFIFQNNKLSTNESKKEIFDYFFKNTDYPELQVFLLNSESISIFFSNNISDNAQSVKEHIKSFFDNNEDDHIIKYYDNLDVDTFQHYLHKAHVYNELNINAEFVIGAFNKLMDKISSNSNIHNNSYFIYKIVKSVFESLSSNISYQNKNDGFFAISPSERKKILDYLIKENNLSFLCILFQEHIDYPHEKEQSNNNLINKSFEEYICDLDVINNFLFLEDLLTPYYIQNNLTNISKVSIDNFILFIFNAINSNKDSTGIIVELILFNIYNYPIFSNPIHHSVYMNYKNDTVVASFYSLYRELTLSKKFDRKAISNINISKKKI